MGFVAFEQKRNRFTSPKASISKGGTISFNTHAIQLLNLREFKTCVLFYDKEEQQIGIELSRDADSETGLKVRQYNRSGADIRAKKFFEYFDVTLKDLTFYEISLGDKENFLIIDLKKGETKNQKEKIGRSQES